MAYLEDCIPEIDLQSEPSDDGRTLTLTLKSGRRMSNSDVILELEYLISQLTRAEEYLSRPDAQRH